MSICVRVKEIEYLLFRFEYGKLLDQLFTGMSSVCKSCDNNYANCIGARNVTRPRKA